MSNESVVPVFGTFDRDTGVMKGVGPLGVPYTPITGGGGGSGSVGTFANTTLLQAAFPAASNLGAFAQIGTAAPYAQYTSNGQAWSAVGTGGSGGAVSSVNTQTGAVVLSSRQLNAFPLPGTWNGATNTAYDAHGAAVGSLTAGTVPPVDLSFTVVGCPTATPVSISDIFTTVINGDVVYYDSVRFQKVAVTNIGLTTTVGLFGDGVGGLRAGVPGTDYMPGSTLACNVPVASAPDGSIAANGALTLSPTTLTKLPGGGYSNGIWLYFPANVINGSNAAGFYWAVFTNSGSGTIYNNVYTPGTNSGAGSWRVPTTLVPFSGTTGTAYTGTTASVTTHSFVIPGNAMGPNGVIRTDIYHRNNTTAGAKAVVQKAGSNTLGYSNSQTTQGNNIDSSFIWNRGLTNVQEALISGAPLHSNAAGNPGTIDTTANFTLTMTTQTSTVSTDWVVIESLRITVLPGA